jgi:Zn-dependent protease with chaperone function
MSKSESIKEELAFLRDETRNLFLLFMALITGSFTLFFQVLIQEINVLFTLLGVSGIVLSLFVMLLMKKKRYEADQYISELEKLEKD